MKMIRTAPLLAVIASAFVLAACGKKEEAPKPVVTPAPAPVPVVTAPPPVAPAGISVSSVSLGNQVDEGAPALRCRFLSHFYTEPKC